MPIFALRNGATLLAVFLLDRRRRLDAMRTSDASASAGGRLDDIPYDNAGIDSCASTWIAAAFGSAQRFACGPSSRLR
jgi:hypothetical protein